MIKVINNLPDNVLGFTAIGKITAADYEAIVIPALEEKLKTNQKVRMLYQLGTDFTGFDMGAMLDDAKMGMKHLSAWDRIALVSDHEIINLFAKFFGYLMTCELRIYKDAEFDEAKKWISEK